MSTQKIGSEVVGPEVVVGCGEDGQEDHVDVVEAGGAAGDRALDVAEAALLEVVHHLRQVVRRVVEERQDGRTHELRAVLHHRSTTE